MKKLILILQLVGIGVVGCGGSSSEPSIVKVLPNKVIIDENNQIKILSEGITQTGGTTEKVNTLVKLGSQDSDIKFYAQGNQPVSFIEIYAVNDHIKLPSGWINLNNETQQASLQFLAANDSSKEFSLSCQGEDCSEKNVIYKVTDERETSRIAIKFLDAHSRHHSMLPISFSPNNHYYDTGNIGSSISYNMSSSSALVSGELNYSIPNQWAIMQKNRFPLVNVEGYFIFDGKSYTVNDINEAYSTDSPISRSFSFSNPDGQKLSLLIAQVQVNDVASARETGTYLILSDGIQSFEGYYPLEYKGWTDSKQQTKFNFNQLKLKNWSGETKLLTSNLIIPYLNSELSLNDKPLSFRIYDGKIQAFARNEQKGYKLKTSEGYSLTLIHEQKGYLSLRYQTKTDKYICGSAEQVCTGLSIDSDKKTYHFNKVKVGNNIFNGSLFIPGVFE